MALLPVDHPDFFPTICQVLLNFDGDALRRVGFGDDLDCQQGGAFEIVVARMIGMSDAQVRRQPMTGSQLVSHLMVYVAADSGDVKSRFQPLLHSMSGLIVFASCR